MIGRWNTPRWSIRPSWPEKPAANTTEYESSSDTAMTSSSRPGCMVLAIRGTSSVGAMLRATNVAPTAVTPGSATSALNPAAGGASSSPVRPPWRKWRATPMPRQNGTDS